MIEAIGWLGSFMLGICGLPLAMQCLKQKHAKGISKGFLLLWLGGEILMQVYVISKHGFDMPLLSNYWLNTVLCLVIAKFMFFPNRSL
jgi:uncharacterized protein with PQ loop repeat